MHLERRVAPRRNTQLAARIAYDGGRAHASCTIRNVSETGCKLEVATVVGIPNSFDLLVPGHRPQACRVVWRTLKELGAAFTSR